jgi:hypothetical protein
MQQKNVNHKKIKETESEDLREYKQKGNTIIRIYGDSILPEEEQKQALEKCKEIG